MEAIWEFTQQLYRTAQDTSTDGFQNRALAALAEHIRFEAALWLTGRITGGQLHVHRLHAYRVPRASLEEVIALVRQHPQALAMAASTPGCAQILDAAEVYAQPASREALARVQRWGIARQLLIASAGSSAASGQWLSLHRPHSDAAFDAGDQDTLRLLMPHLIESRSVNRALSLRRASGETLLSPGPRRALTLLDGTVLHCGDEVREAIGAIWPHWSGLRLPAGLLARLLREAEVPVRDRGETIAARKFSDSLVLSVKSVSLSERLTRRECEVVRLLAAGSDYRDIARRCELAPATVRSIVRKSYRKLGINTRAQLGRLLRVEHDA